MRKRILTGFVLLCCVLSGCAADEQNEETAKETSGLPEAEIQETNSWQSDRRRMHKAERME